MPTLEEQISASELRAASYRLHGLLRASWYTAASDALHRWTYYAASDSGPGFPWKRPLHPSGTRAPPGHPQPHSQPLSPPSEARLARQLSLDTRDGVTARREAAARRPPAAAVEVAGGSVAVHGARRAARLLEMTRVVWLSPLGGGACARPMEVDIRRVGAHPSRAP